MGFCAEGRGGGVASGGGAAAAAEEEASPWVDMMIGVMGEWRNESAVAGGIGDSGDEEAEVGVGVADTGEGARVFGTRIPNPSRLRRRESTVSEV